MQALDAECLTLKKRKRLENGNVSVICGSSVPVNSKVQRSCLFSMYADDHCLFVHIVS